MFLKAHQVLEGARGFRMNLGWASGRDRRSEGEKGEVFVPDVQDA